uniref:CCHC-type domain-containing protein n=1 Tax=Lygus hesperus TaxID=30085 RepID=A0A146M201_LYGHE
MDEERLLESEGEGFESDEDLGQLRQSALESLPTVISVPGSVSGEVTYPDWAEQMMQMQKVLVEEIVKLKKHIAAEQIESPKLPDGMEVDDCGVVPAQKEPIGSDSVPGTSATGQALALTGSSRHDMGKDSVLRSAVASRTPAQDRLKKILGDRDSEFNLPKHVHWRATHVDSIKFPKLDIKLLHNGEVAFNLWHRTIMDAIDAQDCAFLINGEDPPESYVNNDRDKRLATKKVKLFIMSHLDLHYQGIVGSMSDPKEILTTLGKYCEPTSKTFINNLMQQFARMNFESQLETPLEFINRFDELVRKVRQINPEIMNEPYIKQTFMGAIRDTHTYQRELDNDAGFGLNHLKNMLVDEFNEIEQMSVLDRSLRKGTLIAKGSKTTSWPSSKRGGRAFQSERGPRGGSQHRNGAGSSSQAIEGPRRGRTIRDNPINKKVVCYNCGRKGHPYRLCRSKLRKCYNCGQLTTHLAAECPEPKRVPGPSFTPSQKFKERTGKGMKRMPKLVQMKLGDAKRVQNHLTRTGQPSTFYIAGDTNLPDTTKTWVVMGDDEQQEVALINYSRERIGQAAMHVSEEPWE